jgi:hypothetical protein
MSMPYLNCPECGLTVVLRFPCAPIEHCPRCLARRRRAVELFVTAQPRRHEPQSQEGAPRAPEQAVSR